jgi:hypothetical protein
MRASYRIIAAAALGMGTLAQAAIPRAGSYEEALHCAALTAVSASVGQMDKSAESTADADKLSEQAERWLTTATERTGKSEDKVMDDFDKLSDRLIGNLLSGDAGTARQMVDDLTACEDRLDG